MKKGFGAGMHTERRKNTPTTSLLQIKFVTEAQETKFKRIGVRTTTELIRECRVKTKAEIARFVKRGVGTDKRAFNSVMIFLYRHGNAELPECFRLD